MEESRPASTANRSASRTATGRAGHVERGGEGRGVEVRAAPAHLTTRPVTPWDGNAEMARAVVGASQPTLHQTYTANASSDLHSSSQRLPLATCCLPLTACYLLPAAYRLPPAAWRLALGAAARLSTQHTAWLRAQSPGLVWSSMKGRTYYPSRSFLQGFLACWS